MFELLLVITAGAALLLIVTVVGHAIWLAVAALIRWMTGPSHPPGQFRRYCLQCGRVRWFADGRCTICRVAPPAAPPDSPQSDLDAAVRQIERLSQTGKFTPAEREHILDVLSSERELLTHQHPAPLRTAPAPAPTFASDPLEIQDFIRHPRAAQPQPSAPRAAQPQPSAPRPARMTPSAGPPAAPPDVPPDFAPRALRPPERTIAEVVNRRTLADLMQRFMEEKNIRWGEIISGILIVGSAVGLVVSLWATLQDSIPYFPALLFMLITAALHAAGLYTLRKWKLKSASRGLLVISTLLIPLNFLAAVLLVESRPAFDLLYVLSVTTGLAVFSALTVSAGRVLDRHRPRSPVHWWPFLLAVMGPSAAQLLIARLGPSAASTTQLALLGGIPFLCFLIPVARRFFDLIRGAHLTFRRARQTFLLLGIAVFSLLTPLGLLAWNSGRMLETFAAASPWLSLAGTMITAVGLVVHRRLENAGPNNRPLLVDAEPSTPAETRTALRLLGTTVMLFGVAAMLAALALAWPRPALLLAVGTLNFTALTAIAFTAGLAVLQPAALLSASLALLIAYHVLRGHLPIAPSPSARETMNALLLAESGLVATVLAAFTAALARWLAKATRHEQAVGYFAGAACLAFGGLLIAIYAGFFGTADPALATPVLAVDAAAMLIAARFWKRQPIAWIGSAATLLALWHALAWNSHLAAALGSFLPPRPFVVAALLHATIAVVIALVARLTPKERGRTSDTSDDRARSTDTDAPRSAGTLDTQFRAPLAYSAVITSAVALPALFTCREPQLLAHSVYALWAAGVWAAVAFVLGSRLLFAAGQALSAIGTVALATALCRRELWWTDHWLDPRHLQALVGSLAIWSLFWMIVRRAARHVPRITPLVRGSAFPVDRVVLYATVCVFTISQAWACTPSIEPVIEFERGATFAGDFVTLTGVAHSVAFGPTAWIALALLGLALAAQLWERPTAPAAAFLVVAGAAVPLLACGAADRALQQQAVPFWILTWGLAVYGAVLDVALAARRQIVRGAQAIGLPNYSADAVADSPGNARVEFLRNLFCFATFAPVVILTVLATIAMAQGRVPSDLAGAVSPAVQIRAAVAFAGPLWVLAAGLVVLAIRDRLASLALAASLLAQFGVGIFYLTPRWLQPVPVGVSEVLELLTWIALGLAVFSLAWQAVRQFLIPLEVEGEPVATSAAFQFQLSLTSIAVLVVAGTAAAGLWIHPVALPATMAPLGSPIAFAALALATFSWIVARWEQTDRWFDLGCGLALAIPLVAAAINPWNGPHWMSSHVLLGGWAALCVLLAAAGFSTGAPLRAASDEAIETRRPAAFTSLLSLAALLGCAVVVFALRVVLVDPDGPWWSAAATFTVGAAAAAFALSARRNLLAWSSTLCVLLAAGFAWSKPLGRFIPGLSAGFEGFLALCEMEVAAISLVGIAWTIVEIAFQHRRQSTWDPRARWAVPHGAALFGLMGAASLVVLALLGRLAGHGNFELHYAGGWLMLETLAVLLVALLWERTASHAVAGLYGLGLLAVAALLGQIPLQNGQLVAAGGTLLAGFLLITGLLWLVRERLEWVGVGIGMSPENISVARLSSWLPRTTLLLAAFSLLALMSGVLSFDDLQHRLWAAIATLLLPAAIGCFAQERRAERYAYLCAMSAAATVVALGWATIPPANGSGVWLSRMIRLVIALAGTAAIYGIGVVRIVSLVPAWFAAARRAAVHLSALTIATLVGVLGLEAVLFVPGEGAPVSNPEIGAVALVLVGLAAALVSLAVLPSRDRPGGEPAGERRRMLYVYAAEVVLVLLFVHIWLTKPEYFRGYLRPYWPFILMAIAFSGAGVSELFERMRLRVLSEPLRRTGAFLPLLPALGFWALASDTRYSLVLVSICVFYVVMSLWRKSFWYSAAAAIAGNGAVWALLHDAGLTFLGRPQMWLIPPALCVLAAAQLNRDRLSKAQLTGIRYLAVLVIYASSTAEMFLVGVGDSLWLPMILATLSVGGVLAGILLRVRAFLYLGSAFLLLSMVSMVWHAAQNIGHVWPWWAFGILLGLAILTLFALFEKKRHEMLSVLAELRDWEK